MIDAFEKMDRMYRYQRYFYDLTRKYYLLGRDRLLKQMKIAAGDKILEAGCGTARNLIIAARNHQNAQFFGLDASAEMLKTAKKNVDARKISNIALKTALADDFAFDKTFELNEKFDAIFFSYALSIIPPWREALDNGLRNLKTGKTLYIVDFYDQADLPVWFQKLLQNWLKQFHVEYRPELLPYLEELQSRGIGRLAVTSLYKRYSFIAEFRLEKDFENGN